MEKRYIDLIHELEDCNTAREKAIAKRDALRGKLLNELSDSELQRLQAVVERDALREEVQRQRNAAIAAQALLADPSELQKRVLKAESVSAELREGLQRYEVEYQRMIAERDALREELAALREQVAWARWVAQNALNRGGDRELVYAPIYQQALEDIASEPQDA